MAYSDEYAISVGAGMNAMGGRVDPLLACLHENVKNYREHKSDEKKQARLLTSIVAMLDAELSANEKILAADVLITLIKQATKDLRHSLANQLAHRNDLPDTLLHFLSYGDIDLAEPVLKHSSLLSDTDLIYIIQAKGKDHWQAIAGRHNVSNNVCKVLVSKKDKGTNLAMIHNDTIELAEEILHKLGEFAMGDGDIANELVEYKTLPASIATTLYWHVSVELRRHITDNFEIPKDDLDAALEACVLDFRDTVYNEEDDPTDLMIETANRFARDGKINEDLLVHTLRQRQGRFFVALFSLMTGLKYKTLRQIMKQKAGHSLAVACRASHISKENFVSIFLLARAIATPKLPVQSDELNIAMRYYETLTYKVAKDILDQSIV